MELFANAQHAASSPNLDQMTPEQLRALAAQLLSKVDTMGKGATCVISSFTNSGINFRSLVLELFSRMGVSQAEAAISEAPLIQSLGRDGRFTGRRFRVDQRFKLLQQRHCASLRVQTATHSNRSDT